MQFPPLFFIKKIIQPQIIIPLPYGDYFRHWINMKEGKFNNEDYPLVFQAQFKFKWPILYNSTNVKLLSLVCNSKIKTISFFRGPICLKISVSMAKLFLGNFRTFGQIM
jgi:hypothetical protein